MSGQDEKLDIIDRAERKYEALMRILQIAGNPQLPSGLTRAITEYEELGAIRNSMVFEEALSRYRRRINVPAELKPKFEQIANEKGPSLFEEDFLGYWERWNRSLE